MSDLNDFAQTAKMLDIPRHVLELWLKKFPLFQPKRSETGFLGFNARDIALGHGLRYLLITEKKNISEVQKIFNERGIAYIIALGKEKMSLIPQTATQEKNTEHAFIKKKNDINDITNQLKAVFESTSATSLACTQQIQDEKKPSSIEKNQNTEGGFEKFEENWRGFMYDNGKAVTPEEIRAKRTDFDVSEEGHDLVFVDDDPLVADIHVSSLKIPTTNNYSVITSAYVTSRKKHDFDKPQKKAFFDEDNHHKRLTAEKKEKIYHVLAKLDILKSELYVTKDVIISLLKAFGYSGFGDAYGKHDNKSAY